MDVIVALQTELSHGYRIECQIGVGGTTAANLARDLTPTRAASTGSA